MTRIRKARSRLKAIGSTWTITILVFGAACGANAQQLIAEGDSWRYYKGSSMPPLQGGVNWTQPGYNDTTWGGPAPAGFGYGDGDDATVFSDMQNNYLSVYLRRNFTVPDPAAVSFLTLAVDYDDGFVAYLNGVEIARRNIAPGTVTNSSPATANHEPSRGNADGFPQEKEFIAVDKSLLTPGTNLLAIEGHNVSLTSSDFSLIPELYQNVNLLRGPYLQMPVPGTMTVVWRTDALTDSVVEFGLDTTYSGGTTADAALVRDHQITLPVLQPNQTYFFRIRSAGVILSSSSFRSAPTGAQPFRFSVVGDFGYNSGNTTNVANRIADSNPDLLLTVGDNIYEPVGGTGTGQPGVYDQYWFRPYAATIRRAPLFPALGNHDIETDNGSWYLKYFYLPQNGPGTELERNYSFDYGNAHFAVVDANAFVNPFDANRSAAIKTWLAADLGGTTRRWKFLLFHQPAYSSSGNGVHSPEVTLQNELAPICEQNGVQMIFQGHNHFYERINPIHGVHYIITGTGGRSLTSPSVFPTYSAVVNSSVYSFTQVDIAGGHLVLKQIDATGAPIDSFEMDLDTGFQMDGLLDSSSYQRAANGLKLNAAIRGNRLYLATQDAGEGNDHFIYLNNQTAALRAANWAKAGQVMTWSAFLADENDNGFKGWFGAAGQQLTNAAIYSSTTSGLNNNGSAGNGVIEGTIDLVGHFGSFPATLYLAAAPFGSADGQSLVSSAQVPAGNGDTTIQANEFLVLNSRDIALDLPTSNAGTDQAIEAGMAVLLSGAGSTNPSNLPFSYAWTQNAGPPVTLGGQNTVDATFAASSNVASATDVTFRLRVNDTRFDADDFVTVRLDPMVDSDNDGLSDAEELTGADNVLTAANPHGKKSDPGLGDSDGDGSGDGSEALVGTDPNSAGSSFHILSVEKTAEGVRVFWASQTGVTYRLQRSDGVSGHWDDVGTNVSSASGSASSLDPAPDSTKPFYRVRFVSP